jgi:hypothetical protein
VTAFNPGLHQPDISLETLGGGPRRGAIDSRRWSCRCAACAGARRRLRGCRWGVRAGCRRVGRGEGDLVRGRTWCRWRRRARAGAGGGMWGDAGRSWRGGWTGKKMASVTAARGRLGFGFTGGSARLGAVTIRGGRRGAACHREGGRPEGRVRKRARVPLKRPSARSVDDVPVGVDVVGALVLILESRRVPRRRGRGWGFCRP